MVPGPGPKPPLKNVLPKSTGDNKLTEQMVPGYTGSLHVLTCGWHEIYVALNSFPIKYSVPKNEKKR